MQARFSELLQTHPEAALILMQAVEKNDETENISPAQTAEEQSGNSTPGKTPVQTKIVLNKALAKNATPSQTKTSAQNEAPTSNKAFAPAEPPAQTNTASAEPQEIPSARLIQQVRKYFPEAARKLMRSQAEARVFEKQRLQETEAQTLESTLPGQMLLALENGDTRPLLETSQKLAGLGKMEKSLETEQLCTSLQQLQPGLSASRFEPFGQQLEKARQQAEIFEKPSLKKLVEQSIAKRKSAFIRDPAGYVSNHLLLGQGADMAEFCANANISRAEYLRRSLALQAPLCLEQGLLPKVMPLKEALKFKDKYENLPDFKQKALLLRDFTVTSGKFATKALLESGIAPGLCILAPLLPQLSTSDAAKLAQGAETPLENVNIPEERKAAIRKQTENFPLLQGLRKIHAALLLLEKAAQKMAKIQANAKENNPETLDWAAEQTRAVLAEALAKGSNIHAKTLQPPVENNALQALWAIGEHAVKQNESNTAAFIEQGADSESHKAVSYEVWKHISAVTNALQGSMLADSNLQSRLEAAHEQHAAAVKTENRQSFWASLTEQICKQSRDGLLLLDSAVQGFGDAGSNWDNLAHFARPDAPHMATAYALTALGLYASAQDLYRDISGSKNSWQKDTAKYLGQYFPKPETQAEKIIFGGARHGFAGMFMSGPAGGAAGTAVSFASSAALGLVEDSITDKNAGKNLFLTGMLMLSRLAARKFPTLHSLKSLDNLADSSTGKTAEAVAWGKIPESRILKNTPGGKTLAETPGGKTLQSNAAEGMPGETKGMGAFNGKGNLAFEEDKWNYIYGRVTSNKHNQERRQALLKEMGQLGLPETPASKQVLLDHLDDVTKNYPAYAAKAKYNKPLQEVTEFHAADKLTKFSKFQGPSGQKAKLEMLFQVQEDGSLRFVTIIFHIFK